MLLLHLESEEKEKSFIIIVVVILTRLAVVVRLTCRCLVRAGGLVGAAGPGWWRWANPRNVQYTLLSTILSVLYAKTIEMED